MSAGSFVSKTSKDSGRRFTRFDCRSSEDLRKQLSILKSFNVSLFKSFDLKSACTKLVFSLMLDSQDTKTVLLSKFKNLKIFF